MYLVFLLVSGPVKASRQNLEFSAVEHEHNLEVYDKRVLSELKEDSNEGDIWKYLPLMLIWHTSKMVS